MAKFKLLEEEKEEIIKCDYCLFGNLVKKGDVYECDKCGRKYKREG